MAEEGIPVSAEKLAADPPRAPYERWLTSFLGASGEPTDPASAARLMVRASAAYRSRLQTGGPRWLPGARELVERLVGDGLQLALVADAPADEIERSLKESALTGAIKVVVTEADLLEPANRLSGHQLALSLLNSQPPLPERLIHPHEVVAVEADEAAVRAAAEAGLAVIRVGKGAGEESPADHRAGSLAEIDPGWLGAG
jgi:beta-phosphoglucomutase-like phosphatase (HAD superfamily)